MEKAGLQGQTWCLYVIYFRNKQNIHINLIGFDRNLIIHISMLSPLSPENSPKSHNFSTMKKLFVEETFDRYLLLRLASFFSQNSRASWKIVTLLLYLSKID